LGSSRQSVSGLVKRVAADNWQSADAYEGYVGRWSRLVAREFLGWLDVGPGRFWLDVGSGTGALGDAMVGQSRPGMVLGRSIAHLLPAGVMAEPGHRPCGRGWCNPCRAAASMWR
jgi:hypothetical protein